MGFDVHGALAAGYTPDEVEAFLIQRSQPWAQPAPQPAPPSPQVPGVQTRGALGTPQGPAIQPRTPGTPGLLIPGNIDLHSRPVVVNPDGSISTVRSASFDADGREVLVPTVSDDGRILSDREAWQQYQRTGKHLGIFDTPGNATTYSQRLHDAQANEYGTRGGPVPPPQDLLYPKPQTLNDAITGTPLYQPFVPRSLADLADPEMMPLTGGPVGEGGGLSLADMVPRSKWDMAIGLAGVLPGGKILRGIKGRIPKETAIKWAIDPSTGKVLLKRDSGFFDRHVDWFEDAGLPHTGEEFDRIPRGNVMIGPGPAGREIIDFEGKGGWTTGSSQYRDPAQEYYGQVFDALQKKGYFGRKPGTRK